MTYWVDLGEHWQVLVYDDGRIVLQHKSCVIHKYTGRTYDFTKLHELDPAHVKVLEEQSGNFLSRTIELHPDGSAWIDPGGALSPQGILGTDAFAVIAPTLEAGRDVFARRRQVDGA